jgi:hypothetical protein
VGFEYQNIIPSMYVPTVEIAQPEEGRKQRQVAMWKELEDVQGVK